MSMGGTTGVLALWCIMYPWASVGVENVVQLLKASSVGARSRLRQC